MLRALPSHPAPPLTSLGLLLLLQYDATPAGAVCPVWIDCRTSFGCGYSESEVISFATSGVAVRNLLRFDAMPCNAIPGLTGPADETFDVYYNVDVSTDLVHWTTVVGIAHGVVHRDPLQFPVELIAIDTEMLQLDLSGGSLPAGMMIRKSPTQPSPGHTNRPTFQWLPGLYSISSFFDIFTELNLDGGQTWTPADRSVRLTFEEVTLTPTLGSTWGSLKLRYRP